MMRDKELTCYFHYSYGESEDNGFQCLYFYTTYHGIPHLLSNRSFLHVIESEIGPNDLIDPPGNVAMRIKRPGQFWVNIDTSKEIGVEIEDIPLLPFEEILKAFERQVEAGHAYSLNEVRFGYMTFIDPEKKGEEFVLLPVWAAKGRTRGRIYHSLRLKDRSGGKGSQCIRMQFNRHQCADRRSL